MQHWWKLSHWVLPQLSQLQRLEIQIRQQLVLVICRVWIVQNRITNQLVLSTCGCTGHGVETHWKLWLLWLRWSWRWDRLLFLLFLPRIVPHFSVALLAGRISLVLLTSARRVVPIRLNVVVMTIF